MRQYDGPYPEGVPNPYAPMLHSYPTRFHGPIYTRPMFSFPFNPTPDDFTVESGTEGLGSTPSSGADCDKTFPLPPSVVDAGTFAAYMQNEACHSHVEASASSKRWILGLGVAFVAGYFIAKM
jgi:hypothetical protein